MVRHKSQGEIKMCLFSLGVLLRGSMALRREGCDFYTKQQPTQHEVEAGRKNALICSFSKGPVQVSMQITSIVDDSACHNLCLRPNFSADPGSSVK